MSREYRGLSIHRNPVSWNQGATGRWAPSAAGVSRESRGENERKPSGTQQVTASVQTQGACSFQKVLKQSMHQAWSLASQLSWVTSLLSSGRQLKSRVLQSASFQTREIRYLKPFPLPTRDTGVGRLWRREPSYRPDFSPPVWLQEA